MAKRTTSFGAAAILRCIEHEPNGASHAFPVVHRLPPSHRLGGASDAGPQHRDDDGRQHLLAPPDEPGQIGRRAGRQSAILLPASAVEFRRDARNGRFVKGMVLRGRVEDCFGRRDVTPRCQAVFEKPIERMV